MKTMQKIPLFPIDYKKMGEYLHNHADAFKTLLEEMIKDSSNLNRPDYVLAYYCMSFTKGFMATLGCDGYLSDLLKKEQYDQLLKDANQILSINPLCCPALSRAWIACQRSNKSEAETKHYSERLMNILEAINFTGDGTEQNPFYVTCLADEYEFMQQYLDLWDYEKHELVHDEKHICDKFSLKNLSGQYARYEIYFEISRGLQVEQEIAELEKMDQESQKKAQANDNPKA